MRWKFYGFSRARGIDGREPSRRASSARMSWRVACAAMLIGGLASGCDDRAPRVLRIGLLVAQSGPSAARGLDLLHGAQLAADEINAAGYIVGGHPLSVRIEAGDDRSDDAGARRVAQSLLDSGVNAVIGPLNTTQAAQAIPVIAERGIPQMITATGATLPGMGRGNVLRLLANDDVQARAMAAFAAEISRGRHIAVLNMEGAFGRGLALSFDARLKERSIAPALEMELGEGPLPDGVVDRLRGASVDTIAVFAREPQLMALLDALEARGATDVDVIGTNVVRNTSVAKRPVRVRALYATATAIDAIEYPGGRAFLQRFGARFHGQPVWGAHIAYDAVYALADAARQARSVDGPDLVTTLKRVELATRLNEQMRFAASGEQVYPNVAIYQVDHGVWALQMISASW